jgi:hypothetical protein
MPHANERGACWVSAARREPLVGAGAGIGAPNDGRKKPEHVAPDGNVDYRRVLARSAMPLHDGGVLINAGPKASRTSERREITPRRSWSKPRPSKTRAPSKGCSKSLRNTGTWRCGSKGRPKRRDLSSGRLAQRYRPVPARQRSRLFDAHIENATYFPGVGIAGLDLGSSSMARLSRNPRRRIFRN